eukprot:2553940-Pyramimonas_sp.AAC.1
MGNCGILGFGCIYLCVPGPLQSGWDQEQYGTHSISMLVRATWVVCHSCEVQVLTLRVSPPAHPETTPCRVALIREV